MSASSVKLSLSHSDKTHSSLIALLSNVLQIFIMRLILILQSWLFMNLLLLLAFVFPEDPTSGLTQTVNQRTLNKYLLKVWIMEWKYTLLKSECLDIILC